MVGAAEIDAVADIAEETEASGEVEAEDSREAVPLFVFEESADRVGTELRDARGDAESDVVTLDDPVLVRVAPLLEVAMLERDTVEKRDSDDAEDFVAEAEPELYKEGVSTGLREADPVSESVVFDEPVIVLVTVPDFEREGVNEKPVGIADTDGDSRLDSEASVVSVEDTVFDRDDIKLDDLNAEGVAGTDFFEENDGDTETEGDVESLEEMDGDDDERGDEEDVLEPDDERDV